MEWVATTGLPDSIRLARGVRDPARHYCSRAIRNRCAAARMKRLPRAIAGVLLMQYNTNSHIVSTNIRLRWEYIPGSELFLAYNQEQTADGPRALVQGCASGPSRSRSTASSASSYGTPVF